MSATNHANTSGDIPANPSRRRGLGRKLFWASLIVVGVLAISRPLTALHRPFGLRGHWGISQSSHSSPQELEAQWNRGVDWLLKRVDATAEQRDQVQTIQNNLIPDLHAFQTEHEVLHTRMRQAFGADALDRAELEQIRTDSLDLADRASRRAMDSFAQMHEVLTPEQRGELLELWQGR